MTAHSMTYVVSVKRKDNRSGRTSQNLMVWSREHDTSVSPAGGTQVTKETLWSCPLKVFKQSAPPAPPSEKSQICFVENVRKRSKTKRNETEINQSQAARGKKCTYDRTNADILWHSRREKRWWRRRSQGIDEKKFQGFATVGLRESEG